MPFGPTHTAIRLLAKAAIDSFYADLTVLNGDNVPKDGPLLVCCNHGNMTVSLHSL